MGARKTRPSVIYAIQCVETDKIYVGCTQDFDNRIRTHFKELEKGEKTRQDFYKRERVKSDWQNDFDKYGRDSFKVFILERNVKPEKAASLENYWIRYYDTKNPKYGYNIYSSVAEKEEIQIESGIPKKKEYA